jgi:hypothetical protein
MGDDLCGSSHIVVARNECNTTLTPMHLLNPLVTLNKCLPQKPNDAEVLSDPDDRRIRELEPQRVDSGSIDDLVRQITEINHGNGISDEEFQRTDEAVSEMGIEALAWYIPYHASPRHWGIYMLRSTPEYIKRAILPHDPKWDRSDSVRFVIDHEIFHFHEEMAASHYEVIQESPCYLRHVAYDTRSEALANANAVSRTKRFRGHKGLYEFMLRQPPGYRDFKAFIPAEKFRDGLREQFQDLCPTAEFGEMLYDIKRIVYNVNDIPYYIVHNCQHALTPLARISVIEETETFKKSLEKLGGNFAEKWQKAVAKICQDVRCRGAHLEKITGELFTVRVDRGIRAIIRLTPTTGTYEALDIGTHDDTYRRIHRL